MFAHAVPLPASLVFLLLALAFAFAFAFAFASIWRLPGLLAPAAFVALPASAHGRVGLRLRLRAGILYPGRLVALALEYENTCVKRYSYPKPNIKAKHGDTVYVLVI